MIPTLSFALLCTILGQIPPAVPVPVPYLWPPGLGGSGPFSRTAHGRLTGELREHLVILKGTTPVLLFEPAAFQALSEISVVPGVNDFAMLSFEKRAVPFGDDGDHDELITAGVQGLDLIRFTAQGPSATTVHHGPRFQGSAGIRVGDLDGDDLEDLVVLMADLHTIRILRQQSNGSFLEQPAHIAMEANVREFDLLEFDGNSSTREIAVDSRLALQIFSLDCVSIVRHPSLQPTLDCMTVLPSSGSEPDAILWCTGASADLEDDEQNLMLVDHAHGAVFQDSTHLGIARLTAGSLGQDEQSDAVASLFADDQLLVLLSQPGPNARFAFLPDSTIELPLANGAPGVGLARPLVTDLDHDGAPEVVYPVDAMPEVVVFSGFDGFDDDAFVQTVNDFERGGDLDPCYDTHNPGGDNDEDVSIFPKVRFTQIGAHYDLDDGWQLESRVYIRGRDEPYVDPTPVSYCSGQPLDIFPRPDPGEHPNTIEVGLDCTGRSDFSFYFYLRLIYREGTLVVWTSPPLLGSLAEDGEQDPSLLFPGWENYVAFSSCGLFVDKGLRINGFSRIRVIPPMVPNGQAMSQDSCSTTHH